MAKWEYKQYTSGRKLTEEGFIEWLNKKGQDGWEMVENNTGYNGEFGDKCIYTCIFKRKIED